MLTVDKGTKVTLPIVEPLCRVGCLRHREKFRACRQTESHF